MNRLSVLCLASLVACDAAPLSVPTAPADAPQLQLESLDGLVLFLPQDIEVELADGRRREARFRGQLRVDKDDGELIVHFTDLLEERQPDDVLEQVIFYLTEITFHAADEFRFAGGARLRTRGGEISIKTITGSAAPVPDNPDELIWDIVGGDSYDQTGGPKRIITDKGFGFITPSDGGER